MRFSVAQTLVMLAGACAVSHSKLQEITPSPLLHESIYAIPFEEQRRLSPTFKTILPKERVIPSSYDVRESNIEIGMLMDDSVQKLPMAIPKERAYDRRIF